MRDGVKIFLSVLFCLAMGALGLWSCTMFFYSVAYFIGSDTASTLACMCLVPLTALAITLFYMYESRTGEGDEKL